MTVTAIVFLLPIDRPSAHAGHYTGRTTDRTARPAEHGTRLLAVAEPAGIGRAPARTWTGTRAAERALKRQGVAFRPCSLRGVTPRTEGRA